MPVEPLLPAEERRESDFVLFLSPSDLSKRTQRWICRTLGRSANGLSLSEGDIRTCLQRRDLSATCFTLGQPTWAFASLQYYDWLNRGQPQLWITDVCRVGPKQSVSPLVALFQRLVQLLQDYSLSEVWLMVEPTAPRLCRLYEDYGFQLDHFSEDLQMHCMKRTVIPNIFENGITG